MADDLGDLSNDVQALVDSLKDFARQFLDRAQTEVSSRAVSDYMRQGGKRQGASGGPGFNEKTGPGSLRIMGGRLARSLQGARNDRAAPETISRVQVTPSGADLTFGSAVPYAAIHEHGGTISVTESMRDFFWAKFYAAGGGAPTIDSERQLSGVSVTRGGTDDAPFAGGSRNAGKWKGLALAAEESTTFKIPARPYLEPALSDALPKIQEIGEERFSSIVAKELNT